MSYYRNIDSLAQALYRAREEGIRVNLLIGAGCSVTAGIPTAEGIIDKIKKEYSAETKKLHNETYSNYMGKLTPIERRKLINKYVKSSKINWAHIGMAHLMKENFIHRVLTTNFDNIFLRACSLVGEFPGIYDMTTYGGEFRSDLLSEKSILYLHGQHTSFVLCNTEMEVEEQREKLTATFNELKTNSMWIIVGYSCMNDAIWQLLSKEENFENRLYLIGYENNTENENMKVILGEDKYAFYVKGYNADSFFIELMNELDIFPPKIIDKPFTYLSETINSITEYKDNNSILYDNNYNGVTLEILNNAIENYENDDLLMAKYYYNLGVFKKFKDRCNKLLREKEDNNEFRKDINNLYNETYYKIKGKVKEFIVLNKDKKISSPNIIKKLRESTELLLMEDLDKELDMRQYIFNVDNIYKRIDKNLLEANDFICWVNIILKSMEIDDINKAFDYLDRAEKIYKDALSGTKEDSIIVNNMGDIYLKMAQLGEGSKYIDKMNSIMEEAYQKDNNNIEVIINWGIYLLNSILIDESRWEEFYNDAIIKFTEATRISEKENYYKIKLIYVKVLKEVILNAKNEDIINKCIYDFIDNIIDIYTNENIEIVILNKLEELLVKIINTCNIQKYICIFRKYVDCIKSIIKRFVNSENFSGFIININNIAYHLIEKDEFTLSKELIELCIEEDENNSFPIATKGLWYFKNINIDINKCEKNGIKYYKNSYDLCGINSKLYLALNQKFCFEYAVFLYERKKDEEKGYDYLKSSLEFGEIEGYLKNYIDIEKYIVYKNIIIKPIVEDEKCEVAMDKVIK